MVTAKVRITRVCYDSFKSSTTQEYPVCDDVHVQHSSGNFKGQDGGQDMFNRVRELCCECGRCIEMMMVFVNTLVQIWYMKESMYVVEDDFAANDGEDTVTQKFVDRRQLGIKPIRGPPEFFKKRQFDYADRKSYKLVAKRDCCTEADVSFRGLAGRRLDLVILREQGCHEVYKK